MEQTPPRVGLAGRVRAIAARFSGREAASAMIEYTLVALAVGIAAIAGVQALTGGIGDAVELHQQSVLETSSGGDGGGSDGP